MKITKIFKFAYSFFANFDNMSTLLVKMCRRELCEMYDHYRTIKMTPEDWESWESMYNLYKSFGGNGQIDVYHNRLLQQNII